MGIFDKIGGRLRDIGKFGETIKRSLDPIPGTLVLDDDHATWAAKAASHLRLDWEFARFSDAIKAFVEDAARALEPLTSEARIAQLPERARTVNEIHAKEFAQKARQVLIATRFEDLYQYDEDHQRFLQAMQRFRDESARNATALRELLGAEVDAALGSLQRLEDETIRFAQLLEGRQFLHVKRLKEAHEDLVKLDERRSKEQVLLESLRGEHEKAQERITQLEDGIKSEESRIRNDDARAALNDLAKLEEELERHVAPVRQAARDALRYYRKHKESKSPGGAMRTLEAIDKDAIHAIVDDPDRVAVALSEVAQQMGEESRPNTRQLASRLERIGSDLEPVAQKVRALAPGQSQLRRGIMRDVAALGAYDKRQFLHAARQDAQATAAKIAFLQEDLDPGKRVAHERALKDAALALGAIIPGEVPAQPKPAEAAIEPTKTTAAPAPEAPVAAAEADEEVATAEKSLQKAQELLGKGKPAKKRSKGKR